MADVESDIKDWSGTTSSNKPTDSTAVGAGAADNFQQIQATVKNALNSKGSDIASATTTDLGATVGLYHDITGTTTITGLGTTAAAGQWKILQFDGTLVLTHNATSLILPGNANITTAAGDHCMAVCLDGTNWAVLWYTQDLMSPIILDEDDMSSDSATNAATQQSIKAYVDAVPNGLFVGEGTQPLESTTALQVNGIMAVNTWETVGPTGSGKDNIWTALDGLPSTINWIEVRCLLGGLSASDTADAYRLMKVFAADDGTPPSAGDSNAIAFASAYTNSSGSASGECASCHKIPVTSRAFNLRWNGTFNNTAAAVLYLVGYGYN